jgi:broad specificity phosphatase PhoE
MASQAQIHLVRHAQGFHNLGAEFHSLPDPKLTPLGESQCATLQADHFPLDRQLSLSFIAASPLTRTLQTAFLTFKPALTAQASKCSPTILAIPDAQETSDFPCDTGSDVAVLQAVVKSNNWPVDLSLLHEKWNVKTLDSRYSPASTAISIRARACRKLLRQKARELAGNGEKDIQMVLVTHGGYLHYLTDDWESADKHSGTGWENTECRTYTFDSSFWSDDDEEAFISETMESRKRRGLEHPMLPHSQQREIYHRVMQGWEDQGLQNPDKLGTATPAEGETGKTGNEPADLERHVTKAADDAEQAEISTHAQSVRVSA